LRKIVNLILQCLLAIFIMTLINGLTPLIGLIPIIGVGDLGYILFHLLIVLLTFVIFTIWISKIIKSDLKSFRITQPSLNLSSIVLGFVGIGVIYVIFIVCTQGYWKINTNILNISTVILITSLATAISEELFFRGFMMGLIEKKTNIYYGLIVSSIIFSLLHLMSGQYDFKNIILIIIGLFIAGIFYGLVTIYYRTIWASIAIHFLFDATQLFDITTQRENEGIAEYIYKSSNILITGGEYGSTVSVITMFSFLLMIIFLLIKLKRRNA